MIIERATILQARESVTSRHLAHESALQEGRTQLPLHSPVDEGAHGGGYAEHADIINNGFHRLANQCERRAVREDHQRVGDESFAKHLSAQEEERDAVRGKEVERIWMPDQDATGDSD